MSSTSLVDAAREATPQRSGLVAGVRAAIRETISIVALWRERNRLLAELRQICGQGGHILEEIGLTRSEVTFEASQLFWRELSSGERQLSNGSRQKE
jgi:uncharacterized protein YjiS (DUF1127 family)